MKPLLVALTLFLGLANLPALAGNNYADNTYTLTQGSQWRGVKIGGVPPRTLDTVCENDNCYQLNTQQLLSREMSHKYGIRKPSFDELSSVDGVVQQDNKLILPADLGYEVYMLEYWNRYENDGGDVQ
ncbi:MAG: hypothetical protein V7739_03950 [Motiliproteus sp.]